MEQKEIWRPVVGFEGLYEVSSLGRVRSLGRFVERNKCGRVFFDSMILTQHSKFGYCEVALTKDKTRYYKKVHQLVALAFVDIPKELQPLFGERTKRGYPLLVVNHKDKNKANNTPANLEWCTQKYNVNYDGAVSLRAVCFEKPIAQYNKDGVLVGTYKSATEAARAVGTSVGNISKCANGVYGFKTARGYFGRYIAKK